MKKKVWELTVLDNPNGAIAGEDDIFYTTDTEAFLIFQLTDEDLNPTTATLTLINTSDKSVISESVPVVDKVIEWEMTEEAIEHSGNWQAQLVYTQEKAGKPEQYTSEIVRFDVQSHLMTGRQPALVAIEDWDTFLENAQELLGQFEDETNGILIDIKELEQQYRDSEQTRVDAENVRKANESARQAEEAQREENELARVDNEALRKSSEAGRVSAEQNRVTAENERNDLYNLVQQKLENGEFVGEKGDTGDGLEYIWNGTQLGVRKEGETEYVYVDLKGDKGDAGEIENLDSTHIVDALGYMPISVDDVPELTKETVETALGFSPLPSEGGNIKTYVETTSRPTVSDTTVLDLSLSNVFEVKLSQAITLSITNPDTRTNIKQSFNLIIHVGSTPEEIIFPPNVGWQGGEIPDLTGTNKTYILTFMMIDNGMFWYGILDGEFPRYVLATDSDFSGTDNDSFKYIGTDEYVEIPHVIKGVNVTSYKGMFEGTSVKGVASNNKNITTMSNMFRDSQATSLDLSSFDTSNVTTMIYMFDRSQATSLDLRSFDTSNVTNMGSMFRDSQATSLDLSSFDTSNVITMSSMFAGSQATSLDLSSFDTNKVNLMGSMFKDSQATIGYARTQEDADEFNSSSNKPEGLTFVVK